MSFDLHKRLLRSAQALNRINRPGTLTVTDGDIAVTIKRLTPGIKGKSYTSVIADEVAELEKLAEEHRATMAKLFAANPLVMVDPLKRTVGGPQAPCLSGDYGWVCDNCTCWKQPGDPDRKG